LRAEGGPSAPLAPARHILDPRTGKPARLGKFLIDDTSIQRLGKYPDIDAIHPGGVLLVAPVKPAQPAFEILDVACDTDRSYRSALAAMRASMARICRPLDLVRAISRPQRSAISASTASTLAPKRSGRSSVSQDSSRRRLAPWGKSLVPQRSPANVTTFIKT